MPYQIRLKTTAKLSKNVWTGNAASEIATLTVTYEVYDEEREKEGITSAVIVVAG